MGKLTATALAKKLAPGRYVDGDGLCLLVGRTGARSWVVRVQKDKKRRDIGLGSESKVSLKLARERAARVRAQIEVGIDPIAERRKAAGIPTFREAAALVHAEHLKGWKNGKHKDQWLNTLESYGHVHILMHLPRDASLSGRTGKWLRLAGGNGKVRASRVRSIGGVLISAENGGEHYRANADAVLAYVLKGASRGVGEAPEPARYGEGGLVIGKRCGWTQNVGITARLRTKGGKENACSQTCPSPSGFTDC